MSKVIVALVSVLLLVCLAIGGVFLYKNFDLGALVPAAAQAEESPVEETKEGSGQLAKMKPAATPSDIPSLLTYAMKKNLDAVGWLDVPGTDISQVVMQGPDNAYYERRNEDGKDDIYGCYFLDMECSLGTAADFLPNTVIYGHSDLKDNSDGPRFSQLFRFVDDTFAQANKYMYITTLEGRYTFEIFSVFYTDTSFDYIRVHMDDAQTLALVKEAQSKSIRDYGITVQSGERILTLSTCSIRDGNNGKNRFVVMGRLIAQPAEQVPDEAQQQEPASSEQTAPSQDASAPEETEQSQPANAAQGQQPIVPDVQVPQIDIPQPDIPQPQIPDIPQIQPAIPNV